jgi:general secretion pathway protein D
VNLGGQPIAADNGTGSTANAMGMPSAPVSLAGHAMPIPPPPPGSAGATAALPPVFMNVVVPSTPERVGSTFQTSIELNGGTDVYSVPLELHYDADKLTLINVDGSDLLGNDGQTISLVHRDDGKGTVVINASRPPGVKGVNGNGAVCVATFVAKAPGDATVSILKAQPRNSAQQTIPANAGQAVVHIQ